MFQPEHRLGLEYTYSVQLTDEMHIHGDALHIGDENIYNVKTTKQVHKQICCRHQHIYILKTNVCNIGTQLSCQVFN